MTKLTDNPEHEEFMHQQDSEAQAKETRKKIEDAAAKQGTGYKNLAHKHATLTGVPYGA